MRNWKTIGLAILTASVLAACSTSGKKAWQPDPNPHEKVGKPYQVNGVWYVPKAEPRYDRIGFASWYGPGFHGRLTANGEVFDEDRLTAAHPTLPLPSIVEVTNPQNGKRLKLRVNDRGPFANNRILDLSKEAAKRLGTKEKGVATVRVRYIGPARIEDAIIRVGEREKGQSLYASVAPPPSLNPRPEINLPDETDMILADLDVSILDQMPVRATQASVGQIFVQVGAYGSTVNATNAVGRIPPTNPVALHKSRRGGQELTLVRLGPFSHPFAAQKALEEAWSLGFADAHIVEEVTR
ncbi:septal ring lytic transglycosylase RlpA family protein [Parvularcula sp. ZS-1/3]|uniref:Endolytic peptidoglycan transglycosylase RlpA n=1 Tax=Parvularcula mediterranea TaxID=2732508 RepID=A0A7Y3RJP0_9PROT|nr:septal ring lytic transglycosylase RlpA family protein [Parvularcula mediterranea]NNU14910.1 septal ring lytic transglycosylase RlpA family protein [Parvularcula mediterranea]